MWRDVGLCKVESGIVLLCEVMSSTVVCGVVRLGIVRSSYVR